MRKLEFMPKHKNQSRNALVFANESPTITLQGLLLTEFCSFRRTAGNQAVQRLIKSRALQAKLRIGQPNDIYEQEADRVAAQIMRMPDPILQAKDKMSNEWEFSASGERRRT